MSCWKPRAMLMMCALICLVGKDAPAQNVLYSFNGDAAYDFLGTAVSGAGDVNNDGYSDFIARDSGDNRIAVYSGQTGAVLHNLQVGNGIGTPHSVSDCGDVNNDGHADFMVGNPDANNIAVFSGLNGAVLYSINGDLVPGYFGRSVSGAGDVNNDGHTDFVAGAMLNSRNGIYSGMIRVFSGRTGAVLYSRYGDAPNDQLGVCVSDAGDVNLDGNADIVAGAWWNDFNFVNSGMIRVYSGQSGAVLHTFYGDDLADNLGVAVSGAGDVNNDGHADLIAGAWLSDKNGTSSGMIRVYSGQSGAVLYSRYGTSAGDGLGGSVSGAADMNQDGYADFVAGARYSRVNGFASGTIRVYSGQTGGLLFSRNGAAGDYLGGSVSDAGDVNKDGIPDVISGSPGFANAHGKVEVYTGPCARIESYGIGCLGAGDTHIPELLIETDCWGNGASIGLRIQNGWGGGHAFLFAGTQKDAILWKYGCVFYVQAPLNVFPLGPLDNAGPPPNGNGSLELSLGISNALVPESLVLQAAIVQPNPNAYKNLTNSIVVWVP